jgi:hypothetical protein
MSVIKITDSIGAIANVTIRDDSPIAKAKLTELISSAKEIVKSFTEPVDQSDIGSISLGAQFTSPNLLSDVSNLSIKTGANCDLAVITSKDRLLFADDSFYPLIPITPGQCWVEFGIDLAVEGDLTASSNGFGVAIAASSGLSVSTYTLFDAPLPSLSDALAQAIETFSLSASAKEIRNQRPGTANVSDLSGSVELTGSYSFPFDISPLASANLPFNFKVEVAPTATAQISGSISVAGDFLMRSHKMSSETLQIGIYKKRGTTLTATLSVDAGIAINGGDTDLAGALLNAALPGVDVTKAGLPADLVQQFNSVIKDGLDRSLSIELNTQCAASNTHEAAIVYEVDLAGGDLTTTDAALTSALKGDWTLLANLTNAKSIRNIVVDTKERKTKFTLNLFGAYSATSMTDYLSKCTILRDDLGQISIIDKLDASRISASTAPYAADTNKLRRALAEDFLATATYTAIGSKLKLDLTLKQSYFSYARTMNRQQFADDLRVGFTLGVIDLSLFSGILASNTQFDHASVNLIVAYDSEAVLSMFFKDTDARIGRKTAELEEIGRTTMVDLLNPDEDVNRTRIDVLKSDSIWAEMDNNGNIASFKTLPYLDHLNANELADVGADWVSIAWWRDAMLQVAPILADVLSTIAKSGGDDPSMDPDFIALREKLAKRLGSVAKNSNAAFVGGWGPAVMFALSGKCANVEMQVAWDGNVKSFHTP